MVNHILNRLHLTYIEINMQSIPDLSTSKESFNVDSE